MQQALLLIQATDDDIFRQHMMLSSSYKSTGCFGTHMGLCVSLGILFAWSTNRVHSVICDIEPISMGVLTKIQGLLKHGDIFHSGGVVFCF